MALELHDRSSLEFFGRFDHRWSDSGLSELPGQLPAELNKIVVQTYYDCVLDVYNCLKEFLEEDYFESDEYVQQRFDADMDNYRAKEGGIDTGELERLLSEYSEMLGSET